MTIKGESNPLAPIIVVNTNPSSTISPTSTTSSAKSNKKPKKSKIFATKDSMLNLIESVNSVQDGKIQAKLDRSASYLQRLSNIEKATQERKSLKNERLNKIKDNLRKGGVRVKGENKKTVRGIQEKESIERGKNKKTSTGKAGGFSKNKSPGSTRSAGSTRSTGSTRPTRPTRSNKSSGSSNGKSNGKPSSKSSSRPINGKIQKKVKFSV